MKEDMSEEELLEYILENVPSLKRSDIEKMVLEYEQTLGISRKTALYLIFLEYSVSPERKGSHYLTLEELINGLSNVHLLVRVMWLTPSIKYKNGVLTRGGIMDKTAILPVVFWNRSLEDLKKLGIDKSTPLEIKGCYTRSNIQGDLEVHVPERASLEPRYDLDKTIPKEDIFFKPLDSLSSGEPVFTYGVLLTRPSSREILVEDKGRVIHSFYIGYMDKAVRCTSWSDLPDILYDLSPGTPVKIYYGKGRINRFGEFEIRLTRFSHVEPSHGMDIPLQPTNKQLSDVVNGFNMARLYLKLVSFGVTRKRDGKNILNILVYDGNQEATLTVMDPHVEAFTSFKEGDEIFLEFFRAIIRSSFSTSLINIFTTEITKINRSNDFKFSFEIPTLNVKEIAMHHRYINIMGKIVSIKPSTDFESNELIMEDQLGEPFTVVYRGDLSDYSMEDVNIGDQVIIKAALVDLQSLLSKTPYSPLRLRMRAFSRVEKI